MISGGECHPAHPLFFPKTISVDRSPGEAEPCIMGHEHERNLWLHVKPEPYTPLSVTRNYDIGCVNEGGFRSVLCTL